MTTIVFIPGAWITPALYQPFLEALAKTGYNVHYADYPSLDPMNPSTADCKTDTEVLTKILHTLVEEEGQDVLLMMHSYAGMPGAGAACGLAKSERTQQNKPGGIVGLIFIAAFLVPEGLSCAGLQGGNLPPWILLDKPSPQLNYPDDPVGNFAPEVESSLVQDLESKLKPHSTLAFTSPQPAPAWAEAAFQGRLAFIVTSRDLAVPKEAQYGMMAATQQQWIVKEMECSHCAPFLDRVEETVQLVGECAKAFNVV
ncbi:alpha/beta-hydrolase [Aspergillus ellipticus CBS 707.79]|uniref:Alpha/beta-hydrolase n=1 Tax=Aspergillus ellipticus CBS 707.79 TaxID=1448320 RepID=A0A319DIG1_9EURO|nr:alpha/beta-hydrolase [Aspergillus ellipticus CBS 707.79]